MEGLNRVTLCGLLAAGGLMAGCSSDDNLDGYREYPTFPSITSTETATKRTTAATLVDDNLAYQAALLYEVVLNNRAYDEVDRPISEPDGSVDCQLDGFIYHKKETLNVGTPFGNGPLPVSQVVAYGCTTQETGSQTEVMTLGQLNVAEGAVPCATATGITGNCDISYTSYGSAYSYGVQYLTPAGAGVRDWDRVEIQGYAVDGPREVEIGGATEEVEEQRQNLLLASSVAKLSATDVVSDEKVFSMQYGSTGSDSAPFVMQKLADGRLFLDGVLSSGAIGEDCTGGRFTVDTEELLTPVGANITAGELVLKSGSGAGAPTATLVFQANGDVVSGATTITRAQIDRSFWRNRSPVRHPHAVPRAGRQAVFRAGRRRFILSHSVLPGLRAAVD